MRPSEWTTYNQAAALSRRDKAAPLVRPHPVGQEKRRYSKHENVIYRIYSPHWCCLHSRRSAADKHNILHALQDEDSDHDDNRINFDAHLFGYIGNGATRRSRQNKAQSLPGRLRPIKSPIELDVRPFIWRNSSFYHGYSMAGNIGKKTASSVN